MTVVTFSREMGSEGAEIARQVAEQLGYRFVSKATFEKILKQYGLVQLDELYKTAPGFWARLDETNLQLVSMLNQIILGIARQGNTVMLGRGGFAALHGYTDVFHVLAQAPFPLRVQRVMLREILEDQASAEKMVAENDKARRTFIKAFYDVDVEQNRYFDLMVNTRLVAVETAVSWIVAAVQAMPVVPFPGERTTDSIVVDAILADAIKSELDQIPV
jgi:cytidylate kinase